jgi:serine/threonine protein kinase
MPPYPKKIGKYQIDGLYAQGGMSVLYLATDPETGEHLLVKVLLPRFLSDPAIVEQFVNEARIIASSDHPNIVKLYEYGEWENGIFIAMELIKGTSLRKILRHNPLPLKKALEVLIQVCYATSHLHHLGIVHGDLKPENILITDQGQVKIIDFGIAKVLSDSSSGIQRFAGTPIYMSPEVQKGPRNCSAQSDIYSIGIIAYELVMGKITHGRIILTLAPRGLQPILAKALQPKPEDRYQDINDLIHDFSEYIHSGSYQKDRQGVDYFFELFEELESTQKNLLTQCAPKGLPQLGITTSYGVELTSLYFRDIPLGKQNLLLMAEGHERGVKGIISTYRLHSLLEAMKTTAASAKELVDSLFEEANKQNISFRYSALIVNIPKKSFQWIYQGFGLLFHTQEGKTSHLFAHEKEVLEKSYSQGDRFVLVGCTAPSLLEFSSSPLPPLDIVLTEAIQATNTLAPVKQTGSILQKLRLRGGCIVDDHPVCIISFIPE